MGKDDNAKIFSVIGSAKRTGRWRVPAKTETVTLFGRCVVDLRMADTDAEELSFKCLSVFANVTFIVPEGAEVRPSGMAIVGSSKSMVPAADEPCRLPPISVDATTVIGRLRIRTTETDPEDDGRKRRRRRKRRRSECADDESLDRPEAIGAAQPMVVQPPIETPHDVAASQPVATPQAVPTPQPVTETPMGAAPITVEVEPEAEPSPDRAAEPVVELDPNLTFAKVEPNRDRVAEMREAAERAAPIDEIPTPFGTPPVEDGHMAGLTFSTPTPHARDPERDQATSPIHKVVVPDTPEEAAELESTTTPAVD